MIRVSNFRLAVILTVACPPSAVLGQVIFQDEMLMDTNWSLVSVDASDSSAIFGFDYSAFGIPEAPHSQAGDAPTSGLQMKTNIANGAVNAIAAYPTGMNFGGKFKFQFDMWMNAIGPFPEGGNGSTEFGGGSIGFDNATTNPLSGAGFHVSGEGHSSADYRLYAHDELQSFRTHLDLEADVLVNDLFDPKMEFLEGIVDFTCPDNECGGDNADNNSYVEGLFPGRAPPQKQQDDFPLDQFFDPPSETGLKPGSSAFQWMTIMFTVDTEAGTAFVQMTSAANGNTADIGTFTLENTYVNRTTIDEKLITTMEGNVSVIYRDPFSSLIIEPALSFGVFDNVIVTQIDDGGGGVDGDYNGDGVVNAADYTDWRDTLGQSVPPGNGADGDGDGEIGPGDYNVWKANYGATAGSVSASAAIPEPTSGALLISAFFGLLFIQRQRRPCG